MPLLLGCPTCALLLGCSICALLLAWKSAYVCVCTEVRGDAGYCTGVRGPQSEESVHALRVL